MNLKKWEFFTNRIDYIAHVIRPGHLKVLTRAIDAIKRLEHLTNVTEIQSFLGLRNVFCRYVPNFACFSTPLNKKIRKGELQTFDGLTDDKITALETLKAESVKPPGLDFTSSQGTYSIDMDAWDK